MSSYPLDMNISLTWILYKKFQELRFSFSIYLGSEGGRPREGIYKCCLCIHKALTVGTSEIPQWIKALVPQQPTFEHRNSDKGRKREPTL